MYNKINFGRRIRERQDHLRRRGINSQAKGPVFDETPESEGRTEEAIRPGGESFRVGYGGTVFGMGPDAVPPFFENGDWNMRRKRSEHNGTKNPTL